MAMSINERNEFILSNLGLINTITTKYAGQKDSEKWEDSFQNGVVKFLEIIDRYDEGKAKLSTFIWPHIQNCITEQNTDISATLRKNYRKIMKAREILENNSGCSINNSEVAAYLGTSEKKINDCISQVNSYTTVSLNPVSNSEDSELDLLNMEFDNPAKTPEENFMKKEETKLLRQAWKELTEEERTILSYRTTYGTTLEKPLSLRQIADLMGSNRTTIGEKEKRATAHLKKILQNQGMCA